MGAVYIVSSSHKDMASLRFAFLLLFVIAVEAKKERPCAHPIPLMSRFQWKMYARRNFFYRSNFRLRDFDPRKQYRVTSTIVPDHEPISVGHTKKSKKPDIMSKLSLFGGAKFRYL